MITWLACYMIVIIVASHGTIFFSIITVTILPILWGLYITLVGRHVTGEQTHGAMLVNTLRPRQNGHHLPDGIFKCIFLNENAQIFIKVPLTFVPKGPPHNIPGLVEIMARRLPELIMVSLLTHIYITWPQWAKAIFKTLAWGYEFYLIRFVFHCSNRFE